MPKLSRQRATTAKAQARRQLGCPKIFYEIEDSLAHQHGIADPPRRPGRYDQRPWWQDALGWSSSPAPPPPLWCRGCIRCCLASPSSDRKNRRASPYRLARRFHLLAKRFLDRLADSSGNTFPIRWVCFKAVAYMPPLYLFRNTVHASGGVFKQRLALALGH